MHTQITIEISVEALHRINSLTFISGSHNFSLLHTYNYMHVMSGRKWVNDLSNVLLTLSPVDTAYKSMLL